jgi:hypothetical protein
MKAFKRLGFTSEKKGDKSSQPQRKDSWGCSEAQRAKIEVMWKMCARNPSDRSLRAFIKRIAKVDHPAFLRPHLAQKVIIALEKMTEQTVYKPKAKKRLTP